MSDTTVGSLGVAEGVAAYVRDVRAELADLPIEDVEDLTGGMEADLTELAADCGGDLAGRLGSPRLYAAELRAAAGLPERVVESGRRRWPLGESVANVRASVTMFAEQHSWLRSVMEFLVTLRPAWWVLRGYLAAWALWSFILGMRGVGPQGVLGFALALAAIIISVQLGRGWLRHVAMIRPLLVLGNTIAVVVALVFLSSGQRTYDDTTAVDASLPGVTLDGTQVGDIYAYDSDGQRISRVRLFARDGRPLNGAENSVDANGNLVGVDVKGIPMAAIRDSSGASLLNVYPQGMFGPDPWQVIDPASQQADQQVWTPPMSIVPLASSSTPTPTPTPTATAIPTAIPTASAPTSKPVLPTATSPTPSSGPSPSVTRSGR